jgi:hypothetical protein
MGASIGRDLRNLMALGAFARLRRSCAGAGAWGLLVLAVDFLRSPTSPFFLRLFRGLIRLVAQEDIKGVSIYTFMISF